MFETISKEWNISKSEEYELNKLIGLSNYLFRLNILLIYTYYGVGIVVLMKKLEKNALEFISCFSELLD